MMNCLFLSESSFSILELVIISFSYAEKNFYITLSPCNWRELSLLGEKCPYFLQWSGDKSNCIASILKKICVEKLSTLEGCSVVWMHREAMCILIYTQPIQTSDKSHRVSLTPNLFKPLNYLFYKVIYIIFLMCSFLSKAGTLCIKLLDYKPFSVGLLKVLSLWTVGLHVLVKLAAAKLKWYDVQIPVG